MSKQLRIGLLFDDSLDRPDGVQQYVRTVGRWLNNEGHEVSYLVGETKMAADPGIPLRSLARNVRVSGNQNRLSLPLPASPKTLRTVVKQGQFDVIHVQMPYNPFLSGRLIKRLDSSTALVGTFHIVADSPVEKFGSRLLGLVQKKSLARCDRILAVSAAAKEFAERYFPLQATILPNAVELERFIKAKPLATIDARRWNVMFLGRLVERKGAAFLLEAVAALRQKKLLTDMMFHICGDGPLRRPYEEYVSRHGLDDYVQFHGYISEQDKPKLLASADVSVFPATGNESFGIVLVEAMAAGKGVVLAGDNAGYSGVMDYHAESLFNPHDHEELARRILSLKNDFQMYQELRSHQQGLYPKYDINVVGPKLVAIYREAMANRLDSRH